MTSDPWWLVVQPTVQVRAIAEVCPVANVGRFNCRFLVSLEL